MIGEHNLSNCLASLATAYSLGIDLDRAIHTLSQFCGTPGRLQPLANTKKSILIDYAHTPDALENVLRALRSLVPTSGRLLCLFGCGGDRDRGKRPLMAQVAAQWSDQVFLTSDNPRTEDPEKILLEIKQGFPASFRRFEVVENRQKAIEKAIKFMEEEDILLIAGKGHENYQILGNQKVPFDDRLVASEFL